MPKILFVSNTAYFSKFNMPFMKLLESEGWIIDYASGGDEKVECHKHFVLPITRSPWNLSNIKALKALKNILDKEEYDIIHCHNLVGGIIARLAARDLYNKKKVKIIYTAHGFHFYKGSSFLSWVLYYPVEKYLSHFTDVLITINREDYELAYNKFTHPHVIYTRGVGVNVNNFSPITISDKKILRHKLNLSDSFTIIYVAEFIKRKNHRLLIKTFKNILDYIPDCKLILCGQGTQLSKIQKLCRKLKIFENVVFTGYVRNVSEYYKSSDLCISTSFQEGFPLNMIEAVYCKVPVIASNIRGHRDFIRDCHNGYLFNLKSHKDLQDKIMLLYFNEHLRESFSDEAYKELFNYDVKSISEVMKNIYISLIENSSIIEKEIYTM